MEEDKFDDGQPFMRSIKVDQTGKLHLNISLIYFI